jgi:hypothetical protein
MRTGLPLAFANGPPPWLVLGLGVFITGALCRLLWTIRGTVGRASAATKAMLGFAVAIGLAGVFLAIVGLADLFPQTEQRTVVPISITSNTDSRGNRYFDVRAINGTEYWSAPSAWAGLSDGVPYACRVHVYLLLIRPTIIDCEAQPQ